MQNLFSLLTVVSHGITKFPEWNYIRDGLKRNLGTVISYHRKNPMAIQSSHFLVRLLQSITVPQSQNIERYYDNVDGMALNLSMVFKMTSSIYHGQVFNGIFYGHGNAEILIAHSDGFDPIEANRNWQNLCPVKVLRHARSDLGLNIPDGINSDTESGINVILINIPLLAVQYRAFRNNENYKTNGDQESQLSIMHFIYMYVLPNMLFSHLDQAIFNRINNLQCGAPLGESQKRHSYYLTDYSEKLNHVHKLILANLLKVGRDFSGILLTVPAVTKETMEGVMLMPDIAPTRQVTWGIAIARLQAIIFLFRACRSGPSTKNQNEINRVLRNIQLYRNDNLMKTMLPLELYFQIENDFAAIELLATQK